MNLIKICTFYKRPCCGLLLYLPKKELVFSSGKH